MDAVILSAFQLSGPTMDWPLFVHGKTPVCEQLAAPISKVQFDSRFARQSWASKGFFPVGRGAKIDSCKRWPKGIFPEWPTVVKFPCTNSKQTFLY